MLTYLFPVGENTPLLLLLLPDSGAVARPLVYLYTKRMVGSDKSPNTLPRLIIREKLDHLKLAAHIFSTVLRDVV